MLVVANRCLLCTAQAETRGRCEDEALDVRREVACACQVPLVPAPKVPPARESLEVGEPSVQVTAGMLIAVEREDQLLEGGRPRPGVDPCQRILMQRERVGHYYREGSQTGLR